MNDEKKVFLFVGGGSGGHITPLVAVANQLKKISGKSNIIYVGQKGENLKEILDMGSFDSTEFISAGKFRRYHGESLARHLFDFKTIFLNFRDIFKILVGFIQSWFLIGKVRPDVIFLKGGFVCVPVGWAATLRKIPYVTHDSDSIPGLANRLTAKKAKYNMTALPINYYNYDKKKAVQVGIPVQESFKFVNKNIKDTAKLKLGLKATDQLLFVVGGGLGSQKINIAMTSVASELISSIKNLKIVHVTGKKLYEETKQLYEKELDDEKIKRVFIIDFTTELYSYSEAADLVVTRAGATNIAEFATQAKVCLVIPAPHLTGGQQLHNAKILSEAKAAIVLYEEEIDNLGNLIKNTLSKDVKDLEYLATNLNKLVKSDSDKRIADILVNLAYKNNPKSK